MRARAVGTSVAGMAWAAALIAAAAAKPACAQVYPDAATAGTVAGFVPGGTLRSHFEPPAAQTAPQASAGPAWQVSTSLDLSEAFTDNAYYSNAVLANGIYGSGKKQSDFITLVTPSIAVVGDTNRLKVNASYAPQVSVYAQNSAEDQVSQNFNGNAHAIIVPETFFLDLTGFAASQSTGGSTAPNGLVAQTRQSQTQNYSFSATPYLQQRFGDIGLAEIGYAVAYSANNQVSSFSNQGLTTQEILDQELNRGPTGHVTTNTEHASFVSGEAWGRVSFKAAASATQYYGQGIYSGAYDKSVIFDGAFALTRFISALGRVGYEQLFYNGAPSFRTDGPIWAAGAKLTPDPDTQITALIGHRYGRGNYYLNGVYSPTARLKIFASYSQSVTTGLEDIQNTLQQIDVDADGGVFDRTTGAPIAVVNNLYGVQNNVYRLDRGSLSAALIYSRDTFTAAVSRQVQSVLSAQTGSTAAGTSRGTFGSFAWSHDLNPAVTTNVFVQYGTNQSGGSTAGSQTSFVGSVSVSYALSETLSTNVLYTYSLNSVSSAGQSGAQNYVLVGLHKKF